MKQKITEETVSWEIIDALYDVVYYRLMTKNGVSLDENIDYYMNFGRFDHGLRLLSSAIADAINDAIDHEDRVEKELHDLV